jgi:hypothetical protein
LIRGSGINFDDQFLISLCHNVTKRRSLKGKQFDKATVDNLVSHRDGAGQKTNLKD